MEEGKNKMRYRPNWTRWILAGIVLALGTLAKELLLRQETALIYRTLIEAAEVFPGCLLGIEVTPWLLEKIFGSDPAENTEGWERWVKEMEVREADET